MNIRLRLPWTTGLALTALAVALFLSFSYLGAQPQASKPALRETDTPGPASEVEVVKRVDRATERALDYLEKKQVKEGPTAGCWRRSSSSAGR